MTNENEESTEIKQNFPFPVERVLDQFPSVTERYFDAKFFRPYQNPDHGQCLLFHSNRLSLVTLAPEHPILKEKKTVTSVTFEPNVAASRVSGKHKKGGQLLRHNSVLCRIKCDDQSEYPIFACMRSQLTEINERIVQNPLLLTEKTWSDGYIAILLPFLKDYEKHKSKLLTYDEYLTRTTPAEVDD